MSIVIPIVLAAGRSVRMGRSKALLPFGGETAISLVLSACREGGAGPPVVVLGHEAEDVRAALPAGTFSCLNPRFAESGPAASLQAGLDHLGDAPAFLLFPVDFPLVPGSVVGAILERWRSVGGRRRVVVPSRDGRRGHPALFDRSLEDEFRRLPPDGPMHQVLRAHEEEIEHVVVDEPAVLQDLNTPSDYERALEAWRRRRR